MQQKPGSFVKKSLQSFTLCSYWNFRWCPVQSSVRSWTNKTSQRLNPACCRVGGFGSFSVGKQGRTLRGKFATIWNFSGVSFKENKKSYITWNEKKQNINLQEKCYNLKATAPLSLCCPRQMQIQWRTGKHRSSYLQVLAIHQDIPIEFITYVQASIMNSALGSSRKA